MAFGFPAHATRQVEINVSQAQIAQVVTGVIDSLRWKGHQVSPTSFSASAGVGLFSWGENITIDLITPNRIQVKSSCSFPLQCFDWGKNDRNTRTFLTQLSSALSLQHPVIVNAEDSHAGKKASCPNCQTPLSVPLPSQEREVNQFSQEPVSSDVNAREALESSSHSLDVGEIFSTSWRIYKDNMGLLIGASAIAIVLGAISSVPGIIFLSLPDALRLDWIPALFCFFLSVVCSLASFVFQAFLLAGMTSLTLRVIKGQSADIGEVFRGGKRHVVPMALCLFLYTLATSIGMMACLVPGFFVMLVLFPWQQLLVDRSTTGVTALSQALELTKGRRTELLAIFASWLGLAFISLAVCGGVGLILTRPLMEIVAGVTYMELSGQEFASSNPVASAEQN